MYVSMIYYYIIFKYLYISVYHDLSIDSPSASDFAPKSQVAAPREAPAAISPMAETNPVTPAEQTCYRHQQNGWLMMV